MKKKNYVYLALLIIPILLLFGKYKNDHKEPYYLVLAQEIQKEFISDIKKTYSVNCYGSGGGFLHNVRKIAVSFDSRDKDFGIDESRILIVNSIENLLHRVNKNEEIRPYLDHYPFSCIGTKISFSFLNKKGKRVDEEFVAHVFITDDGRICYSYYNQEKKMLRDLYEESYEEALRIVRDQHELKEF